MDVYGDNANIIPDDIPELDAYIEDVMPKNVSETDVGDTISGIEIDVEGFLHG
ncbi:MAG: hypothetical protein LIO92_01545 [Clostridiales bacterium]|nr:hypothetical protein [Clostridiales bacterium]